MVYEEKPSNQSVGFTNQPAPLSATEIAGVDSFGKLQPLLVNGSGGLITSAIVTGTIQPSGLQVEGIITMVTIDNTGWYLAPPSPLLNRNNIQAQNPSTSSGDIIWNYSNSASLTAGIHIPPGGSYSVAIKGSIPVYLTYSGSGSITLPVEELE